MKTVANYQQNEEDELSLPRVKRSAFSQALKHYKDSVLVHCVSDFIPSKPNWAKSLMEMDN